MVTARGRNGGDDRTGACAPDRSAGPASGGESDEPVPPPDASERNWPYRTSVPLSNWLLLLLAVTNSARKDADVRIGGTGIIGGFDHHDEGPGTPGAPRITITGFAFCGTVYVERRSANAQTPNPKLKRARRRLERKQRQLERNQSR